SPEPQLWSYDTEKVAFRRPFASFMTIGSFWLDAPPKLTAGRRFAFAATASGRTSLWGWPSGDMRTTAAGAGAAETAVAARTPAAIEMWGVSFMARGSSPARSAHTRPRCRIA